MIAPDGKVVLSGIKERQGDFVFTAQNVGEYQFCFNNEMSTFAEKFVDFEIAVCAVAIAFARQGGQGRKCPRTGFLWRSPAFPLVLPARTSDFIPTPQ